MICTCEICACEMLFLDAPCCRVSPVKSDSSCADVDGQYLAPPATSTLVSSGQQRYGYPHCVNLRVESAKWAH